MEEHTKLGISFMICVTAVILGLFTMGAWVNTPTEITINLEMDNNTMEALKSLNTTFSEIGSNNNYTYNSYYGEPEWEGHDLNGNEVTIYKQLDEDGRDIKMDGSNNYNLQFSNYNCL